MHPTFHPNFVQFLKEFNVTHDYFECHEVLEEYWKEIAPKQKNHPLTALILMSTSMYHWRRGNNPGALKTMRTCIKRLSETSDSSFYETIDYSNLIQNTTNTLTLMQENAPFQPFFITIKNPQLMSLVHNLNIINNHDINFLIHKHMLRDRSEILKEREKSKKRRNDK
ncbi:DUF309 domain-containing protein [Psychrobacillus sp. FJAT-51614]|uniref:DUF309 domain-containing protein n=1 Tax=Psychrobacillus mangrovi TaxID=3117745 RepID=A0ABU8F092_9BACI